MKRTVFGVFLMVIGMALLITGTTLFSVSARSGGEEPYEEAAKQESRVYIGDYYQNGDETLDKVTVSQNEIILPDGTSVPYILSVWRDIPETEEGSGRITYKDYCFLKSGEEKLSYDPAEREVVIEGISYKML